MANATADRELFRAIDQGDEVGVRGALADGADLNARRRHNTPLLDAVFAKNPNIVSILARAGARMMEVPDSRDPFREALVQGDLPTLAALLDAPATPKGLADTIRQSEKMLLRHGEVRRNMMRTCWKEVAAHLLPKVEFTTPGEGKRWWSSASMTYSPDPDTVELLAAHCPPQRDITFFREMADNGLPIPVMSVMHKAGHLDIDMMFHASIGTSRGFLEIALSKAYMSIPSLKWLLRLASKMPGGADKIAPRAPAYMVYAMGRHASMPLARFLAKIAGEDPIGLAARGRIADDSTTIHLLLDGHDNMRRRLDLCAQLMQAGADPMAVNWRGQPACYKSCMLQDAPLDVMAMMASYGADFSADGPVEQWLDQDKDSPAHLIAKARASLRIHQVDAQHQSLQQTTAPAPTRRPGHRL